jgi:hypothetical protein
MANTENLQKSLQSGRRIKAWLITLAATALAACAVQQSTSTESEFQIEEVTIKPMLTASWSLLCRAGM